MRWEEGERQIEEATGKKVKIGRRLDPVRPSRESRDKEVEALIYYLMEEEGMAMPDIVGVAHWELTGGYMREDGQEVEESGEVEGVDGDVDGDVDPCPSFFLKEPSFFARDIPEVGSEGECAGPCPEDDLQAMVGSKRHYRKEMMKKHLVALAHLLQGEDTVLEKGDVVGFGEDLEAELVGAEVDDATSMAVDQPEGEAPTVGGSVEGAPDDGEVGDHDPAEVTAG